MRRGNAAWWVTSLLLLAPLAGALEPAYLGDWPSAERVLADQAGADHEDTLARQMAALHQLDAAIVALAGPRQWREGLTPDENRLRAQYHAAAERIRAEAHEKLPNKLGPGFHGPFAKPPLRKWYALQWHYETDPEFRRENLARYLPASIVAQLGIEPDARRATTIEPDTWAWLGGLVLVLLAIVLMRRAWRRTSRQAAGESVPSPDAMEGSVFQAAATEVIDSLEPYIVAAKQGGHGIPFDHLMRPFVAGMLIEYSGAALELIRGGGDATREDRARVNACLMRNPRFLAHFEHGDLEAAEKSLADKSMQAKVVIGQLTARGVLDAFAGRDYREKGAVFSRVVFNLDVPESQLPRLAGRPPATRLHPPGRDAEPAQRALLAWFTRALIDPDAGLE